MYGHVHLNTGAEQLRQQAKAMLIPAQQLSNFHWRKLHPAFKYTKIKSIYAYATLL